MKDNLRRLREKANLTQGEFAKAVGYSYGSTISMWESGYRKPPSNLIPRIAKVLNCSIDDLFEGDENSDKQTCNTESNF